MIDGFENRKEKNDQEKRKGAFLHVSDSTKKFSQKQRTDGSKERRFIVFAGKRQLCKLKDEYLKR